MIDWIVVRLRCCLVPQAVIDGSELVISHEILLTELFPLVYIKKVLEKEVF